MLRWDAKNLKLNFSVDFITYITYYFSKCLTKCKARAEHHQSIDMHVTQNITIYEE